MSLSDRIAKGPVTLIARKPHPASAAALRQRTPESMRDVLRMVDALLADFELDLDEETIGFIGVDALNRSRGSVAILRDLRDWLKPAVIDSARRPTIRTAGMDATLGGGCREDAVGSPPPPPSAIDRPSREAAAAPVTGALTPVVPPAPSTPLGQREEEARRIAREEGYSIIGASEDWRSFSLADDLVTDKGTLRTVFDWDGFRFEGHVYYVASSNFASLSPIEQWNADGNR